MSKENINVVEKATKKEDVNLEEAKEVKKATNSKPKTTTKGKTSSGATKKEADTKESVDKDKSVGERDAKLLLELENAKRDNEALRKQVEELLLLAKTSLQVSATNNFKPEEKKYKVIHLLSNDNVCELKTSKGTIRLSGYEDFVEVDEAQFRDIVRDYHNLFAIGFLTTDSNGAEIFKQRKIDITHRWLTNEEIDNLGNLDSKELVELYKTLHPQQKEKLVDVFLKGIDDKKPEFLVEEKILALNKVYDGVLYRKRIKNAILNIG